MAARELTPREVEAGRRGHAIRIPRGRGDRHL
jgi:hypothetical protein